MREIKFRVWDKYDNEMKYDAQDTYDYIVNNIMEDCFGDVLKSGRYEVMQYIGIKDKNGKEIYEGDIIDVHQTINGENVFIIEITDTGLVIPSYRFNRKYKYQYNVRELLEVDEYEKEIEVIGNIYENPDLLGE